MVKIEYFFNNSWHEMERYDCGHGYVHKDRIGQNGHKKLTIKYKHLDFKMGLNYAIYDFKKNHASIVQRYLHEKS